MSTIWFWPQCVNTLKAQQNGQHHVNIFMEEILIKISMKFIYKGAVDNESSLVEVMASIHVTDYYLS